MRMATIGIMSAENLRKLFLQKQQQKVRCCWLTKWRTRERTSARAAEGDSWSWLHAPLAFHHQQCFSFERKPGASIESWPAPIWVLWRALVCRQPGTRSPSSPSSPFPLTASRAARAPWRWRAVTRGMWTNSVLTRSLAKWVSGLTPASEQQKYGWNCTDRRSTTQHGAQEVGLQKNIYIKRILRTVKRWTPTFVFLTAMWFHIVAVAPKKRGRCRM